jgi:hypothetical protein
MKPTILLLGWIATTSLWAQVGAPVLGFVNDGGGVHPVYGIPSAASVARPLESTAGLRTAAASPHQDYLLGIGGESGDVSLLRPDGASTRLEGAAPSPDRIVMSPRGSAAALWYSGARRAQVVSGLPGSPSIRAVDAGFLNADPTALAVSDDGQWLSGSWPAGLYSFGPNGELAHLPVQEIISAVAFYHASHDLALTTGTGLFRVEDVGGRAYVSVLALNGEPHLEAMALALAADDHSAVLADASGLIASIDLAAGTTAVVSCGCSPAGLFPLGQHSFRLTGLSDGAFKLYDARSGQVLFAPVAAEEGGRP